MSTCWLISDTHFGHNNIYRFSDKHGDRMRGWADNAATGDEIMVEAWNSVVRPKDRVYHLGDVAIPRAALRILGRLNGRKVLIRGNHDMFKLKDYTEHFDDIRGMWKLDTYILTHAPIHPCSIPPWCTANVHGHVHRGTLPDSRYRNVSVEVLDGQRPISFDDIRKERGAVVTNNDRARTETTTFVASCSGEDTAADLARWRRGGLVRLDAVEAAVRRSVASPMTTAAIGDGIIAAVMTELRKAAP